MDIHKPKAWDGWRGFLKEYAIIVVGVLTALGAEQAVEWAHWQAKARAADERMGRELNLAYADAKERVAVGPCMERRIADIEARLMAGDGAWIPPPQPAGARYPMPILLYVQRAWDDQVWRSVVADGTAAHLAADRQAELGRVYAQIAITSQYVRQEYVNANALEALHLPLQIDAAARLTLLQELERERGDTRAIAVVSGQLVDRLPKLVRPDERHAQQQLAQSTALRRCRLLGYL
jgi:hypothetical protein